MTRSQAKLSDSESRRFSEYNGTRFAVFLGGVVSGEPLRGDATHLQDKHLGSILRISLDGDLPGGPEIIITESEWRGEILPDRHYGCDYCLILASAGGDES